MSVKINQLEIENVKRIRAVSLAPGENGLTVIGGNNNQGKTSVLDTICWALGGERYRPGNAMREGSTIPPRIKLTLSNGLIVERSGKNSALKVTDPSGRKSGQQLLNEFVEELALNLPKFMQASAKEKANTLLQIIGVGDQLAKLELEETTLYNQRHAVGQERERKAKYAEELPVYSGVPEEPLSISELIQQQQEILARNGENQRKRLLAAQIREDYNRQFGQVKVLEAQLTEAKQLLGQLEQDMETAAKDAVDLQDESTEEIERSIAQFEEINRQIRANNDREKAQMDAQEYSARYDELTDRIEQVRKNKYDLLHSKPLPLPELSVEDGELTYQGRKWDCMSGSDQLRVATAIVRALNPRCGFILLDKLEQMDLTTLKEFGHWLEAEGLQAIATRVSTGSECSIIIEDGYAAEAQPNKQWKEGVF